MHCNQLYIHLHNRHKKKRNTENSKFKSTQYSLQLVWPYSDPKVFLMDQVLAPETARVLL